jgi:TolB protein
LAVIGGALAVVLVASVVGGFVMFGRGGTSGSTAGSSPSGSGGYAAPLAAGPNTADKILFTAHPGAVNCDVAVPNSCQPVHDSQVYMMNPDGSDLRQLTITPGHSWAPRVSPDGTKVIYSSVVKVGNTGTHTVHQFEGATGGAVAGLGHHDIFLAEIDSARVNSCNEEDCVKNTQTVTSDKQFKTAWNNGWSWSPDDQWITFMSTNLDANGTPTGPYQLYKINPTTKQVVHLNPSANNDGWPTWTPDGKHILFSSIPAGQNTSDIYEMDPDGSNVRQLTHGVLEKFNFNQFPSVSPDGQQILFACGVRGGESQICLMGIDGSQPLQLTQSPTFKDAPAWSPDGTKIVYAQILDNDGNQNIYTMNKDGSDQRPVTHGVGEQTSPSWARISRAAK